MTDSVDDLKSQLEALTIDLKFLSHLGAEATSGVVDTVNAQVAATLEKISDIQAKLGIQRTRVRKLIEKNQKSINDFLESAGYLYQVKIEPSNESYRMILEHRDARGHLPNAASHLSYGERNAFALVLFMHQVRHDKPDLVVLDDPVSSFDKTKKFAIFHRLFKGAEGIRGSTTLLLTHDIEPVIDMLVTGTKRHFEAAEPVAYFLRSQAGIVSEQPVSRGDVETFADICRANIMDSPDLIKCIYLRRLLEVTSPYGAVNDVLSSLIHLRDVPTDKALALVEEESVARATEEIRRYIPNFEYDQLLADRRNPRVLRQLFESAESSYEQLQITRMLLELDPETGAKATSDALMKFINEPYHIENEYLMQLNPRRFDSVPEYIRDACSSIVMAVPEK